MIVPCRAPLAELMWSWDLQVSGSTTLPVSLTLPSPRQRAWLISETRGGVGVDRTTSRHWSSLMKDSGSPTLIQIVSGLTPDALTVIMLQPVASLLPR